MASGVTLEDSVMDMFNEMKVRKAQCTDEEKKRRKKAVFLCLSEDQKHIVLDKTCEVLQGDEGDPLSRFISMLPANDCRYALYDASYETKETKKEDLVFILWAPDDAPLKSKMIYASTKDAVKKKLTGIKHEWQVNGMEDIKDRKCLAEKIGGGTTVIKLEGQCLCD